MEDYNCQESFALTYGTKNNKIIIKICLKINLIKRICE